MSSSLAEKDMCLLGIIIPSLAQLITGLRCLVVRRRLSARTRLGFRIRHARREPAREGVPALLLRYGEAIFVTPCSGSGRIPVGVVKMEQGNILRNVGLRVSTLTKSGLHIASCAAVLRGEEGEGGDGLTSSETNRLFILIGVRAASEVRYCLIV